MGGLTLLLNLIWWWISFYFSFHDWFVVESIGLVCCREHWFEIGISHCVAWPCMWQEIQNLIQFKIKSYFITFLDFKPMLSDIVYGLGNQQEGGWLQDITLFNENRNAIFSIHTRSGYKKIHPQSKSLWNPNWLVVTINLQLFWATLINMWNDCHHVPHRFACFNLVSYWLEACTCKQRPLHLRNKDSRLHIFKRRDWMFSTSIFSLPL